MAEITKPPTGFKWSRSGNAVSLEWKIADDNYDDGVYVNYQIWSYKQPDAKNPKGTYAIYKKHQQWAGDPKSNKFTIWLNLSEYYPYTNICFNGIWFAIKGRKHEAEWSNTVNSMINSAAPRAPKLTMAESSDYNNQSTFTWEKVDDDTSFYWFTDYERQTMLVVDCNTNDGSKLSWGTATRYTGSDTSQTITESAIFEGYHSYTRWYRVRCRGVRGDSPWVYTKRVYSVPAYAENVTAEVQNSSIDRGYTRVNVRWSVSPSPAHPIDKTTIDYLETTPSSTISTKTDSKGNKYRHVELIAPAMSGGTTVTTVKDTTGQVITIPNVTALDHCIVVRVNTHHDKNVGTGETKYVTGSFAGLKPPDIKSVGSLDRNTKRISIKATNNSTVENTHLAIVYKSSIPGSTEQCVGIIPSGETSATVILPDSCLDAEYTLGLIARLGDYSPVSPKADQYTNYTLSNDIMSSSTVWLSGAVPQPPSKVVLSSPKNGTIRVGWDWTWTDATGTELSWADHEDAWESTSAPSTYTVNNTSANAWNISGLAVGKWYVRVRLIRETGDTVLYGAYSDIETITLASAPAIPSLTLSESIITETGSVDCYWVYVTGDGTEQQQAEICEASLNSDVTYTYGNVIAKTSSAQSLTILAEEQNWKSGEIHYLAVRVMSASGEISEGWSVPVSITIADKMDVSIFSTSLVDITETIESETESTTYTYKALTSMPLSVVVSSGGDPYIKTEDTTRNTDKTYYTKSSFYILTTDTEWHMDKTYYWLYEGVYMPVLEPVDNPSEHGFYELDHNEYSIALTPIWDPSSYSLYEKVNDSYVLTEDTEWDDTKTYYSRSGSGDPGEYVLTEDSDWDTDKTYYKLVNASYVEVGQYTETEDSEWNQSKIYYSRSQTTPYEYEPVDQYFATSDTVWNSSKTYYVRSENEPYTYTETTEEVANPAEAGLFEALTDPTGYYEFASNPSSKEYYELINVDPYVYTEYPEPIENPSEFEYYESKALDGLVTLVIERADPYHIEHADETDFDGFAGETISIISQNGSGEISFENSDLMGILNDGATYNLVATVVDTYGQSSSSEPVNFTVRWTHQAVMPSAEVEINNDEVLALITPLEPTGYELTSDTSVVTDKAYYVRSGSGTEADPYVYTEVVTPSGNPKELGYYQIYDSSQDRCDIYRLSADKPTLLVKDASFGIKYVDPYPTLKNFGGYRIAYKTVNNDYITEDNRLAWMDYDGSIDLFSTIINFEDDSVMLPYDLSVNNSWSKDFTETKYLGGSIQGDWNSAVSRTGSANTTTVVIQDPNTVKAMRRLAEYTGICHVRTPDGSNYMANVDVKEDREEKWVSKLAKFSLSFTRVDPEELDGILYSSLVPDNE